MLDITTGPTYSFISTKAMIDHILIESSMLDKVSKAYIFEEIEIFTSDHLPICLQFSLSDCINHENKTSNIAWNKCTEIHINAYQNDLCTILNSVNIDSGDHSVDQLSDIITHAIKKAESNLPKSRFNKFTKPYWTAELKAKHTESRRLRQIWILEGKSRGHSFQSYNEYKIAKNNFRRLQRHESSKYIDQTNEELEQAAEIDYRLFWRLLRGRKPKQKHTCTEIRFENKTYTEWFWRLF